MRTPLLALIGAVALLSSASPAARAAEKPIPPPPQYYVLDEPHVLSGQAQRALEALLIDHDRATGQQFLIAVFNSLDGQDIDDYVNRVFQAWKIGQRGKDDGVLLALFMREHQARIEVGYGLEPVLTDAQTSRILHDILVPGMRAGAPDQAISRAAFQILTTLGSPLIPSGRAEQILRSGGDFSLQPPAPAAPAGSPNGWIVWLALGLFLMLIVWNQLSSAEAHFTGAGWYRPRPWQNRWTSTALPPGRGAAPVSFLGAGLPLGLGGFPGWGQGGGGGGGFGGFIGGGGMSGGGGASAGW